MLAEDARTARPLPNLGRLRAAPPLRGAAGFLGFD
jgi:hypothetical protein